MSPLPGLGNANLRLVDNSEPNQPDPAEIIVQMEPDDDDIPDIDEKGNILTIKHGDGSVSVSLDGKPLGSTAAANDGPEEWFGNLVDKISSDELSRITEDLLVGIAEDLESRHEWIEDRALGVKLLGLKIELPNVQGASDGAPVEGMSKVRHPLLLEAVLRFQANARSELLPTDGPVKVRNDSTSDSLAKDQLGNLLESSMNHYLTAVATEYYPDTDRMLFMTGFGGSGFKKIYQCPLRNRPVSESVDADDLIVNQSATDLANAQRVTHRTMLKQSTVKRLQIMGVYRDVDLGDPGLPELDTLQKEEKEQQGLKSDSSIRSPATREREIYEVACELDIQGFEHKHKGKESGLAIPYVVTIDKSSRQALAVTRNYPEDDQELPTAKKRFVMYPFVPGIGFLPFGLLHILGNTTNAITAGWREMLDSGMYANFPGGLIQKASSRQNTNIMRVPPGGLAQIDTGGIPIKDAIMNLPYTTQGMPALMQLVDNMAETGRRIGGTAEVQVGEGRADVPVGTVMAMIDQAIKVMNAVHKRMHAAQAEEFQLLKQVIRENPDEFLAAVHKGCRTGESQMDKVKLLAALESCDLVPQADPNTSSSGQRLMKIMALKQLQQASPNLYDPIKVDTAALNAIGWPNPEEFFVPPAARSAPPPQLQQMQSEMANEKAAADAKTQEAQARAVEAKAKADDVQAKIDAGHYAPKQEGVAAGAPPPDQDLPSDTAEAAAKLMDAHTRAREVAVREREAATEDANRDKDREAKLHETAIGLAGDVIRAPTAGESGKQVGVSDVGKKASKIIKQVDKGLK
jgi:hypothetical protein